MKRIAISVFYSAVLGSALCCQGPKQTVVEAQTPSSNSASLSAERADSPPEMSAKVKVQVASLPDEVKLIGKHLLDAPDLYEIQLKVWNKQYVEAIASLQQKVESKRFTGEDESLVHFLIGRLVQRAHRKGGSDQDVIKAFGKVEKNSAVYVYAAQQLASLYLKQKDADKVIELIGDGTAPHVIKAERAFLLGEAYALKNDYGKAASEFKNAASSGRPTDGTLRLADMILADSSNTDVHGVLSAVRSIRFKSSNQFTRKRAESLEFELRSRGGLAPQDMTSEEQVQLAQAHLDGGQAREAYRLLEQLLQKEARGLTLACKAEVVRAKALERLKQKNHAIQAYKEQVARCPDDGQRPQTAYETAKLAASIKRFDTAVELFRIVERDYPQHRFADDARFRSAMILRDHVDEKKAEEQLKSLPDDYPQGDMRSEALFQLAYPLMMKGDWSSASTLLERSIKLVPREDGYFAAGRARYFLGRAKIATKEVDDGKKHLHQVLREEPLSFAAAMSFAWLSSMSPADEKLAIATLKTAMEREPEGLLFPGSALQLDHEGTKRAIALARIGELELAKKELLQAGFFQEKDGRPVSDTWWSAIYILRHAGNDARVSSALTRGKLSEWVSHYPSGRWLEAWKLAYPQAYGPLVERVASEERVPSEIVWAVMREESAFEPEAASFAHAYGLLQLIVPTAKHVAHGKFGSIDSHRLTIPELNITLGTRFLQQLRTSFATHPALAVPSYNAGKGATLRWMRPHLSSTFDLWTESIPYDETRKYTKRVLTSYYAYTALYAPERLVSELKKAAGDDATQMPFP